MEAILFYVFAALLVASAIGVVAAKNPVHSAMSLIGGFFFLAAIYVLLRAHLVAGLQVLVYAGAIMVLFTFVIMLLSLSDEELGDPKRTAFKLVGALSAGVMALITVFAVRQDGIVLAGSPASGTVESVGRIIYTQHALAFEAVSILLLVAIVGAVVVAKRRI